MRSSPLSVWVSRPIPVTQELFRAASDQVFRHGVVHPARAGVRTLRIIVPPAIEPTRRATMDDDVIKVFAREEFPLVIARAEKVRNPRDGAVDLHRTRWHS